MEYTLKQMQDRVGREMGLDLDSPYSNTQVGRDDITAYLNDALVVLGQNIVSKIKEDYFLTYSDITLVKGTYSYPLPEGILVHKIRKIVLQYSDLWYNVPQLTLDRYTALLGDVTVTAIHPEGYFILTPSGVMNPAPRGALIEFLPQRLSGDVQVARIFYLGGVKGMSQPTDTPALPDTSEFLMAHAKWRAAMDDTTRDEREYEKWRNEKLKIVLELYTDRTPMEGGDMLEMPDEDVSLSVNPAEYI